MTRTEQVSCQSCGGTFGSLTIARSQPSSPMVTDITSPPSSLFESETDGNIKKKPLTFTCERCGKKQKRIDELVRCLMIKVPQLQHSPRVIANIVRFCE